MASEKLKENYDKVGILGSFLCLVHCTVLPIAVAFMANVEGTLHYSHAIDFLFVAVALGAVYFSTRHSSSLLIKSLLWFFVMVFVIGLFLDHYLSLGKTVGLIGSFGLMVTHFFNIRNCRKCQVNTATF